MRVLTVAFDLSKGGTERAAAVFAAAYARADHASSILSFGSSSVRRRFLEDRGVQIFTAQQDDWVDSIRLLAPELVHLHSHGLSPEWVEAVISACPRAIFIETNVFSRPSVWESSLAFSLQLGRHAAQLYVARGGDAKIVRVVPYPMEEFLFHPFENRLDVRNTVRQMIGIPPNAVVVGRVGQDSMGKWSYAYVEVFRNLLSQPSIEFLLVNPPSDLARALMKDVAIRNRLHIIDKIELDEQLRSTYAAMDVMLHVADQGESFGYAVAESIAVGTPVVTLSTPWGDNTQTEIVRHGLSGAVVCSAKNLSEAIDWTLKQSWDPGAMHQSIMSRFGSGPLVGDVLSLMTHDRRTGKIVSGSSFETKSLDGEPAKHSILRSLLKFSGVISALNPPRKALARHLRRVHQSRL